MNTPNTLSVIRLATLEDASSVAHVLSGAFADYEPLYSPEAFAVTTPTADQIRDRWSEWPVWIVVQSNQILGTVSAVPKHPELYVRRMGVVPEARRQDLGTLLLDHVESYARKEGFERLLMSTTPFLHSAIRLYERFGFERTSDGPHTLYGTPLFAMVKVLRIRN